MFSYHPNLPSSFSSLFSNGLLDLNYHFNTGSVVHNDQTRHANDLRINRPRCSKGQLHSSYSLFKEWNEIPLKVRNSENVRSFIKGCFTTFSII